MHPELFRIPFTDLTVKSYGLLMVCGFITAIFVIRRLSRDLGDHSEHITTAALYSLIAGVVGARIFYVIHYWSDFQGRNFIEIFAVWKGGLELLGGVLLAIFVIVSYLRIKKLPIRRYLDILAIGLLFALAFGRLGCFMNGCCYGRPTTSPISVRFPYASLPYQSQIRPDLARDRQKPYFQLPSDYFIPGFDNNYLKSFDSLSPQQQVEVTKGDYRCLPIIPTQLFESFFAFVGACILYFHRRRGINFQKQGKPIPFFFRPGTTFSFMFIIYGTIRFIIEFLRDDNPFQFDHLTISQNLSIILIIVNLGLIVLFAKMKSDDLFTNKK